MLETAQAPAPVHVRTRNQARNLAYTLVALLLQGGEVVRSTLLVQFIIIRQCKSQYTKSYDEQKPLLIILQKKQCRIMMQGLIGV